MAGPQLEAAERISSERIPQCPEPKMTPPRPVCVVVSVVSVVVVDVVVVESVSDRCPEPKITPPFKEPPAASPLMSVVVVSHPAATARITSAAKRIFIVCPC
jgi:hypothetical protein